MNKKPCVFCGEPRHFGTYLCEEHWAEYGRLGFRPKEFEAMNDRIREALKKDPTLVEEVEGE